MSKSAGSSPEWFFPLLGGGEESGLNDAGIEIFKKAERLAREVTQNVQDNRDHESLARGEPAVVTFERIDLPSTDFPGLEDFKEIFRSCQDHVLAQYKLGDTAGNEQAFFDSGGRLLEAETIPTLRVGDENTTGLVGGDADRESPFWRLIRGQGYSSVQGPGGGTYGIGQRAPFAHSAIRTILYATRVGDGSEAFAGKSILASFPDPRSSKMKQNKGWWCVPDASGEDWHTLRDAKQIPSRFRRDRVGTDLYVVGYQREDWQKRVRWSVLEHFFAAIHAGHLVVRLMESGTLIDQIDKSNLEDRLISACDEAKEELSSEEYASGLGSTVHFLRALKRPVNGSPFQEIIPCLGTVNLYVHREPDAPDRWCTMRSPRALVETHGARILRGYAAVFLCDSEEGNRFLRQMEDPAHVRWHEDEARGWNHSQKKQGREVRLAINRFVRGVLTELRQVEQPEEQDIPDLGRYLPTEDDSSNERGADGAAEPTGEHVDHETGLQITKDDMPPVKQHLRSRRNQSLGASGGSGDGEGGKGRRRGGRKGGRRRQGGEGESGIRPGDVRFRAFRTPGGEYRVVMEAQERLRGTARIVAVGEDSDYEVRISNARNLADGTAIEVEGCRLKRLTLEPRVPLILEVDLRAAIPLCLALGN